MGAQGISPICFTSLNQKTIYMYIPLQAFWHVFPVLLTFNISMMAVLSCDGDRDDIEFDTDIGKLGFVGFTLPFAFAQKGIVLILCILSKTIINQELHVFLTNYFLFSRVLYLYICGTSSLRIAPNYLREYVFVRQHDRIQKVFFRGGPTLTLFFFSCFFFS